MTGFAQQHQLYQTRGFWCRPVKPGTKACYEKNWQQPDEKLPPGTVERWVRQRANYGLGLLMGSPICGETTLGALDVDRDEYVELAKAILRNPVCGRVGSKGVVFFVRVLGNLGNPEFRVRGPEGEKWGKVAECLFTRKLCVIPPSIHPETGKSYRWIGTPLLEVDLLSLPVVGN